MRPRRMIALNASQRAIGAAAKLLTPNNCSRALAT